MKAIRIIDQAPQLVDIPRPAGEGVRVRVAAASICGSDLHMVARGWAEGAILGHEFAGYAPDGTAVAVEPLASCGGCSACGEGYYAHCEHGVSFIGVATPGGMAEYVEVPAANLVALPSGLAVGHACLVEPLAVALHGLNQAGVKQGERILVIGAGAIGIATAAGLHARGLSFDIIARHPHQVRAVERFGAGLDVGEGYDVVIDAVGSTDSIADAVKRLRPRGRIAMLGTFWDPVALPMSFCMKEIAVVASMTYKCSNPGRTFEEAVRVLAGNQDIAAAMITHRYPLDGAAEAFTTAADRASGAIKVCFTPGV